MVYKFVMSFYIFTLEQFDEATIQKILEAIQLLMQIDVPESKAKVLMLIAELAKEGQNKLWGVGELFCLGERSELRKNVQGCTDSCTKVPCR